MTSIMSGIAVATVLLAANAIEQPIKDKEIEPPSHQVVVIYFHRTQRCTTCKRISALTKEAIVAGFAKELKTKAVELRMVDFQAQKNAKLAKQFEIKGPTLVLTNVFDGKVVRSTPMPKVWQLVGKPKAFHKYVRDGVTNYLQQTRKEAESKE